jgi:predicted HicB family RNase H-like nuclease
MVKKRKPPQRNKSDQLNVRLPEELMRRLNSVVGAAGKTLTEFVTQVLDERTKDHQADVGRIAERERVPKKWQ